MREKALDLIRRDREEEETIKIELAKRLASGEFSDEEVEFLRDSWPERGARRRELGGIARNKRKR